MFRLRCERARAQLALPRVRPALPRFGPALWVGLAGIVLGACAERPLRGPEGELPAATASTSAGDAGAPGAASGLISGTPTGLPVRLPSAEPGQATPGMAGERGLGAATAGPSAGPGAEALEPVQAAVAAYAAELGAPPEAIEVLSVEPVTWNDGSLGCPQPGQMYIQVIIPGYRVTLGHAGQQATYHTDENTTVVRCDRPGF